MPDLSEKVLDAIGELCAACSPCVLPKSKIWKDFLWVGDPCRVEGKFMVETQGAKGIIHLTICWKAITVLHIQSFLYK